MFSLDGLALLVSGIITELPPVYVMQGGHPIRFNESELVD